MRFGISARRAIATGTRVYRLRFWFGGGDGGDDRGEFAAVDPALKQLLGREPTHFRDVLAATLPR